MDLGTMEEKLERDDEDEDSGQLNWGFEVDVGELS